MKKKILSLILGVSLVGTLLTGCGSAASASAAPAPAAEEAKEEAAPAAEAKADDAAEAGAEDEADQEEHARYGDTSGSFYKRGNAHLIGNGPRPWDRYERPDAKT